jgi:tRNA (cmo5U34)-methyltransferase
VTSDPDQYHFTPATYEEMIRADLPRYDELQDAAINAIPFEPARVLELGFGTAQTTERIWERYPQARITGIDSSPEMVFRARELGWEEMRLGRMQDPLPDGPWDLVIAVLSVHHLDPDQKRDLFRRVREQSRSLVIGDVVEVPEGQRVAALTPGFDRPSPAADQAEWCGGEVVWEVEDLAVIRAVYET